MNNPESPQPKRPYAPRPTTQMAIGCIIIPLILAIILSGMFFYIRSNASTSLIMPKGEVALIRALPEESAPLLARFGAGRTLEITGRTEDWQWLEVALGNGRRGWTLRPLDILVWQLEADAVTPAPAALPATSVAPVVEETVAIPAVSFTMGSPPGLGEADETPAHVVNLSAFEIDRTEVTIGQYWHCVEAGVCAAPAISAGSTQADYLNDPAFDNHPVVNVPWAEANKYCMWRGKRLPTEAEWELAASWNIQKKAKLLWPWGNDPSGAEANVGETAVAGSTPVGSFAEDRSPAGVLDMGGNVSEWVFDWYKIDYYSLADDTDPIGPTQRRGEGKGRVVRGGSFADPVDQARTTNRRPQAAEYGYPTVGFRCVQDN